MDSFETVEQLNQHVIENHSREECPHCNKMIGTTYMTQHIKLRHDIDQRVVCDLCGKVSSSNHMHKYHFRIEHDVQQKLQCDICGIWCDT